MVTPRYDFTAVRLLDGRVLVAGGSGANNESDLTSAELYDPDTGTWSATGNMVQAHVGFPATLLPDGKVLVGDELYDAATGSWFSTGKLVTAATTATLLANGKVLATGSDGAQLYDPDSGTWTATGKMITPWRQSHTATLLPDGKVLVAGGADPFDHAMDSAELYDPDTGSWTSIANMHARRATITATLLRDGKVLVYGGTWYADESFSSELYDPATGVWTVAGDLARPDAKYRTATLLLDGTVLVAGGLDGIDAAETAEVYDPATRSWIETGSLLRTPASAWGYGPATLLLDGTVLVAGGSGPGPTGATGSAELYVPASVSPPVLGPFPSPTPSPSPTPIPTPFPPAAGPVPAGARSWKVMVDNKSSEPLTRFVAEADEHGMLRLVGSATPNVVPVGATVEVTFLFPAKWDPDDGWVFVNPRPGDDGGLVGAGDIGIPGKILIGAEGDGGWLSP